MTLYRITSNISAPAATLIYTSVVEASAMRTLLGTHFLTFSMSVDNGVTWKQIIP